MRLEGSDQSEKRRVGGQLRRWAAWTVLSAAAGLAGMAGLAGCERGEAQTKMPPRPPALVTVAPAITKDVPVYIDQIGRTVPVQTVAIVPQVGGKVIATHVEHGDYVKKGQLLFEIDPRPFDAALASAKASLAQGQAELDLARIELRRVEEAVASAAVSRLEYDQKKSAVAMSEAKMAAAEAALDAAKLDVEYSKIVSPIDGKAGVRRVDPGNVVKANDEPLLMIQQMDPIYAEFTITENDLGTVRKFLRARGLDLPDTREEGLTVLVDIPADSARVLGAIGMGAAATQPADVPTTRPAGVKSGPREGSVMFLDNSVQNQTGTVKMRATLPNADRYFWPGQFVNVRLVLTRKEHAVLVPAQAQQIGQQGPFVYVVNDQNKAEIRPITPGQRHGELVAVEQGLEPGERVVITGHMTVMPGEPVVVMGDKPGVPPGAPGQDAQSAKR